MSSTAWPRLRAVVLLLSFLSLGAGCASVADSRQVSAQGAVPVCSSVNCMNQQAMNSYYQNCLSNLGQYARSPARRRAIDAEFRYPLKNEASYYDWIRMGGTGPSPQQWCRGYAAQKVTGVRPVMSLR